MDILQYEDKTDLKNGLKKMWSWAQSQPDRKRKHWEIYEVEKKIYKFWLT
jgi:UDP-glucose 4-epimerase